MGSKAAREKLYSIFDGLIKQIKTHTTNLVLILDNLNFNPQFNKVIQTPFFLNTVISPKSGLRNLFSYTSDCDHLFF